MAVDIQCGNCKYWDANDDKDESKDENDDGYRSGNCKYRERITDKMNFCRYFSIPEKKRKAVNDENQLRHKIVS